MDKNIKQELKNCKTFNQMVVVLNKHYNLDFKLGSIAKNLIISKIPVLLSVMGAKKNHK